MPGPAPTPAERRARRNTPAVGEVQPPDTAEIPPPPPSIRGAVLEQWHAFWSTDLAGAVAPAHVPALHRLFELRQEALEAHDQCRSQPTVEGSQGQLVANPQCRHAVELDKEIRQLEDRFGMTPMAALRLGVELGKATKARRDKERIDAERAEEASRRADPRVADT